MENTNRKIEKALQPALKRIMYQHYLKWLARALAAGMGISTLFLLLSHFWPWAEVNIYCLIAGAASLLIGLIVAWIKRPDLWEAACRTDACGLKERVTTACELAELDSEMARRQRKDALEHLHSFDARANFPWLFPARESRVFAGAVLISLVLFLLPNPMQAEVERQKEIKKEIALQGKKVAEVKKELEEKEQKLPLEERAEAIDILQQLEKDLQKAGDMKDSLKSLSRAEEKLQEVQKTGDEAMGDDIEQLLEDLKKQEQTRELGEKMAAGDIEGSREELEKLMKNNPEEAQGEGAEEKSLADILEDAAAGMSDPALATALRNAAAGSRTGTGAESQQVAQLNNEMGRIGNQAGGASDINRALAMLQDARRGILGAGGNSGSGQMAASGMASGNPAGTGSSGSGEGG